MNEDLREILKAFATGLPFFVGLIGIFVLFAKFPITFVVFEATIIAALLFIFITLIGVAIREFLGKND